MAIVGDFDRSISAPSELGLETRTAFREAAFRELGGMSESATLRIDLGETRRVDSAGLSTLLLIQRRAAERLQRVVLSNASEEVQYLLVLTEMSVLFSFQGSE
jgi:ABC-type transporter Mla MlaB component